MYDKIQHNKKKRIVRVDIFVLFCILAEMPFIFHYQV